LSYRVILARPSRFPSLREIGRRTGIEDWHRNEDCGRVERYIARAVHSPGWLRDLLASPAAVAAINLCAAFLRKARSRRCTIEGCFLSNWSGWRSARRMTIAMAVRRGRKCAPALGVWLCCHAENGCRAGVCTGWSIIGAAAGQTSMEAREPNRSDGGDCHAGIQSTAWNSD